MWKREMAGSSQEIIRAPARRLPATFFFYIYQQQYGE
jgi:hypothetical protein